MCALFVLVCLFVLCWFVLCLLVCVCGVGKCGVGANCYIWKRLYACMCVSKCVRIWFIAYLLVFSPFVYDFFPLFFLTFFCFATECKCNGRLREGSVCSRCARCFRCKPIGSVLLFSISNYLCSCACVRVVVSVHVCDEWRHKRKLMRVYMRAYVCIHDYNISLISYRHIDKTLASFESMCVCVYALARFLI